ncbi:polyvinylalcohol dehydrogenase, partial [Variovorax sp. RCC_210]
MNSEYQALLATLREEEIDLVESWLDEAQLSEPGARRAAQAEATDILRQLRDALQTDADPARFEAS